MRFSAFRGCRGINYYFEHEPLAGEIRSITSRGEISSFFTEALEHYLAYRKQKIALEKGFGAWKSESHPELATPEDSTTYVRSIREAARERLEHWN